MTYERHYIGKTREELDVDAINDIREYMTAEQWSILMEAAADETYTIRDLNMIMGIAGVSGRPFHAFCRAYRLGDYKDWLRSSQGGDPVECDAQGFELK